MDWFSIFDCFLCAVVLVVHIYALILLYRRKHFARNKNQIFLLKALIQTESTYAVKNIFHVTVVLLNTQWIWLVDFIVWFSRFLSFCLSILYHCFMSFLTLDRFLIFYLNFKYPISLTLRKVARYIYTVVLFTILISLILIVSSNFKEKNYQEILTVMFYVYVTLDILYIVLVVFTYTFIFMVYRRQTRLRKICYTRRENYDQFKLTVPTLIIATYILFSVLPNFLMFFVRINILEISLTLQRIIILMYRFGLITDPLIYVLNTNNRKSKTLTNLSGQFMLKAVGGSARVIY